MAKSLKEVEKELCKATGVTRGDDEKEQSYLGRIVRKVAALGDAEWEDLSAEAQAWYNGAVALANDEKPLESFGDEKPAARSTRAQPAAKNTDPEDPPEPQVGDTVLIVLTNGEKVKGKLTEIDEKNVVLEVDGEEEPYRRTKITSITVKGGGAPAAPAKPKDPEVGDTVEVTRTADGEIFTGELTELDDKNAVVNVNGEEEVFRIAKVTIAVKGAGKSSAPDKTPSRSAPKEDAKPAARSTPPAGKDAEPPKRGGETMRAREIVIDNPDADKAACFKLVEAEGLDVKKVTFDMIFSDTRKTMEILRAKKMLK